MIPLLGALLLLSDDLLAGDLHGEWMSWDITYAGVVAGSAWAEATWREDHYELTGGCQNAPWYEAIYTLDDFVRSTWVPGEGSRRYETRFREGGFHQDQDMVLAADGFTVWRHQEIDGEWRDWSTPYPASIGAEDPVSAIYALRRATGDGPWTWPVFSGKETWPLLVEVVEAAALDAVLATVAVDVLELRVAHEGDIEQRGRFRVYVTDDARRVPVRVTVGSSVGTFRADLTGYRAPEPATAPAE